ncbi:3780_t:CDS:2 [Entrophospora sp. SA101]|nr:3780_t:CDS:2 [Entrophospora sp. SA101]
MELPIISRLNFHDYLTLITGLFLLMFESLLRVVTFCLPGFALNFFRAESQKAFSMLYKDERSGPAKILQNLNTFQEMAEFWGYRTEEHIVKTHDNYILGIHRIPTRKVGLDDDDSYNEYMQRVFKNCGINILTIRETSHAKCKPVVLLYHGFMMCSEVWMCNLEEECRLACLLADAGYDVWLEITEAPSLTYIGFSQGTAQSFAALSINPKLNKKVNLFVALAPATSPRVVDAFIKASPNIIYLFFGRRAFLSVTLFWQRVLSPPIFTKLLDICMNFLFGWNGNNISEEQKAVSYYHLYTFTSVKSHWFQIIRANIFQMYDEIPPLMYSTAFTGHRCQLFPTNQISTPIAVFYGGSDSLVDINVLLKQLPRPVFVKEIPIYEHLV